jgi:hypothetical protein
MKVGWASRPSKKDGRDAHPTITIKIVSYLIRDRESVGARNIAKIWNFRLRLRHWLNRRSIELIDGIDREIWKQSHSFSSLIVSNSFALFSLFESSNVLVF